VPGLAKTLMVESISKILDVSFKRNSVHADLMASDITGTTVLEEHDSGRREFRFVKGPIFTTSCVADDRSTAHRRRRRRAPAAIHAGTAGHRRPGNLEPAEPFFVIATQKSESNRKALPLPEAQLDRFHVQHQGGLSLAGKKRRRSCLPRPRMNRRR